MLSETGLWHTSGWPPLPIHWVWVLDPEGKLPTQAFFTTDLTRAPERVVERFVWRWSLEVTFEETQRQWTAQAIARTTPVLLALFSLHCLRVYQGRDRWSSLARYCVLIPTQRLEPLLDQLAATP